MPASAVVASIISPLHFENDAKYFIRVRSNEHSTLIRQLLTILNVFIQFTLVRNVISVERDEVQNCLQTLNRFRFKTSSYYGRQGRA